MRWQLPVRARLQFYGKRARLCTMLDLSRRLKRMRRRLHLRTPAPLTVSVWARNWLAIRIVDRRNETRHLRDPPEECPIHPPEESRLPSSPEESRIPGSPEWCPLRS